ncbi:hypothetical protein INR49_006840 [Caranx melampygus]|nr:hypothetical protein INR49_006840 [Caranx melampygus]
MPPSSSSSLRLPLLLLLPLLRCGGAAEDADCSGSFRPGQDNFVLDAEEAVKEGAVLLATARVPSPEACERECCGIPRCNLALLEPRGTEAATPDEDTRTCVLFNCIHRNRFVCRFVNQVGYRSYVRESVFLKHLGGPREPGEPIAMAGRDVVVQPGEVVTLNGTESVAVSDAHIMDYQWSQLSGDASVKMEMTDLPDQVRLSDLQVGSYVFQLTVTDSNQRSDVAKVTVLVLSPELSSLYCLAPVKVGPCRAAFPRWRYEATTGDCEQFVFGGCKQNHNNYLSHKECVSACRGVTATAERGAALPLTEVCGSTCRPDQLTCDSGCCLDRTLECDGVKHCSDGSDEEHCNQLNQTFSRLLSIDVNQTKARCTEPPRTGPCRASFTRWYYDPLDGECHRFTFGGCDGNDNNFEEEDKCSNTCAGVTDRHVFSRGMFDRFEKEQGAESSGSIALAVLLSVAILALLAVLTYCFLKAHRKRSHRPVSTGPAHVSPFPFFKPETGPGPGPGDSVMPEGSHRSSYDASMGEGLVESVVCEDTDSSLFTDAADGTVRTLNVSSDYKQLNPVFIPDTWSELCSGAPTPWDVTSSQRSSSSCGGPNSGSELVRRRSCELSLHYRCVTAVCQYSQVCVSVSVPGPGSGSGSDSDSVLVLVWVLVLVLVLILSWFWSSVRLRANSESSSSSLNPDEIVFKALLCQNSRPLNHHCPHPLRHSDTPYSDQSVLRLDRSEAPCGVMGHQRSRWRGGGGGGVVVRWWCSEEEVKISLKSTREERRLRRVFGGLSVSLLFRYLAKSLEEGLAESPRLSSASISSNERAPSATPSDPDLPSSDRRPVSLISTLSSGSGSSKDDSHAPPPLSSQTPEHNVDLDLSPMRGVGGGADREGRSLGFFHSNNNNSKESPFKTSNMAPNPQLTYLDRVVMEIIETERMYVRDLRMIVEVSEDEDDKPSSTDYLAHIIDQSDLSIRPEQVCALFGNIEDIYEFNSELLQALDLCDNDPVAVARCFVMKSEYFEIYTQYCTNYPNSVAALTDCMRNKSLAKFFRERQALLKRSLPLGSYLLKPVQRILKYHLLLQEIAKHFDPEEEGYEVVEEAIYTMTGVAWYINDMKRKHEHAVRLQEVQSLLLNWKGPDLTTYGELVLEGTFKVHRAKNERTLFLFDRMLLITKRRGEHYVYKTHISCSTLMLIESAKDSLSFSVTHYKHPKQPHTVQAKTVEEKKLYRYSPEHLKKALSSQSEEFQRDGRQGRRQSEPTKQILKSTRGNVFILTCPSVLECSTAQSLYIICRAGVLLQHSGSEGVLPEERCSLQPTISSSTLGSSLGEPEAERPREQEGQEEQEEQEEEELGSRKDSLEQLLCSEEEEEEEEEEEAGRLCPLQSQTEDSDPDDILLEDEQVDDFASSVLAAISCWHFRVQAFLSSSVTVRLSAAGLVFIAYILSLASTRLGLNCSSCAAVKEPIKEQASDEPHVLQAQGFQQTEGGGLSSKQDEQPPGEEPGGAEPTSEQLTTYQLLQKTSESGSTVNSVSEHPSDREPPLTSVTPQGVEKLKPEEHPEPREDPASATPDSDSKTLSSGESSEDEEDDKEEAEKQGEVTSILPSSVLDKASAIAQHFTSSNKRGSVAQDDTRSLGCASPRLPCRNSSSLSLSTEPTNQRLDLNSVSPDSAETFSGTDLTLLSPRDDGLFDGDRAVRRRRDSTLSKQDQLLISKIRSYYENAGNQDATFSLQRRESLTYIPTGLVRSSVSRFNSDPKDRQTNPSSLTTSSSLQPFSSESQLVLPTDTHDHMVSSDSLDSLRSDQRSTDLEDSGQTPRSRSQSLQDNPSEDEEFRPSSQMIKIWQAMEQEITRSQSEDRGREKSREPPRNSRATNVSLSAFTNTNSCDPEGGASDLSTITEESTSPTSLKPKTSGVTGTGSLKDTLKVFGQETVVLRAAVPRVTQLKAQAMGERPSEDLAQVDDPDKTKSKVLHLARQYSQRIKTTKPVVRQRSQGLLMSKKSLSCVVEEKEGPGNPALTLVSHKKTSSLPLSSTPLYSSVPSSGFIFPGRARSRSPLSPPPPIEGFNWPDVQELRSKYSDHGRLQKSPVSRSRSIPEQMFDGSLRRHSSCSSSHLLTDRSADEGPSYKPRSSRDSSREECIKRLQRANSLDPRLSGEQMTELQKFQEQVTEGNYDGYFIAAEAPLPKDPGHKIIVVEKLPEPEAQPAETPKESIEEEEEDDDNLVQIRSPTSREKISIIAVIDRCRPTRTLMNTNTGRRQKLKLKH